MVDPGEIKMALSQELARVRLGTKAESLQRLRPYLTQSNIPESLCLTFRDWRRSPQKFLSPIAALPRESHCIAVRSSSLREDSPTASQAGAFISRLGILASDSLQVSDAIDEVFDSYGIPGDEDQVLIQEMLERVSMAGVVMTRTPSTANPWRVFNFDDSSTRTDSVTTGDSDNLRTIYLHRDALETCLHPDLVGLLRAVQEIENLVGNDSLDIEFAIDAKDRIHILQVRPIAYGLRPCGVGDHAVTRALKKASEDFDRLSSPRSSTLDGAPILLSNMADWNPAEIIGVRPRALAFSLYRHLITDDLWAEQRADYGYHDLRPQPLLVDILGHPYVDVRASFNSFIPAGIDHELAHRMVNIWIHALAEHPHLHDKVEFEVAITCWSSDFAQRVGPLKRGGVTAEEISRLEAAYRELTLRGMTRLAGDVQAVESCYRASEAWIAAPRDSLDRAEFLLQQCRHHGIPAFAHLARNGFVAATLLQGFVAREILCPEEVETFKQSVPSVSSILSRHASDVAQGRLSWKDFVDRYGHLRPGTYEITSPSYREAPEEFLRPLVEQAQREESSIHPESEIRGSESGEGKVDETEPAFNRISLKARERLESELHRLDPSLNLKTLDHFLRRAIQGREWGKFVFSRLLSAALDDLGRWGALQGLSREELANIPWTALQEIRGTGLSDHSAKLKDLAHQGEEAFALTRAICLPSLIGSSRDFLSFEQQAAVPNFITHGKARAPIRRLSAKSAPGTPLESTIALLPNADPGFDWIFGRRLAGLITMYGGANSHMAIRASEFNLPAAIGVGELLFERLNQAALVELDCEGRRIEVIR